MVNDLKIKRKKSANTKIESKNEEKVQEEKQSSRKKIQKSISLDYGSFHQFLGKIVTPSRKSFAE